jgi:hypothetical protein
VQEDGTRATGLRSKFTKQLGIINKVAKDKAYRAANMTINK